MKTSSQLEATPVKELVRAGHEFAAAMGTDTPLIEIAKLVSRLATALDVQFARANALTVVDVSDPNVLAQLDELEAKDSRIEEQSDYFSALVAMARKSADKAMRKFPQPNYVLLKVAEEAGEVVQAGVHYAENRMTWDEVEGEIVQLLSMLIRLVTEGDQINGVTPPQSILAAAAGKGE